MKKLLYIAGLTLTLGNISPAQAQAMYEDAIDAPSNEEIAHYRVLGQEFLKTSTEMWFLLSSISSRTDADTSATLFAELLTRTFELDNQLSNAPIVPSAEAECAGMMDGMQLRILEVLDEIQLEFISLCRARCYGSSKLQNAFIKAVEMGLFPEETLEDLRNPGPQLNDAEAIQELNRMQKLAAPDRSVLNVLLSVHNETTATKAIQELFRLADHLQSLTPAEHVGKRKFGPKAQARANEIMAPIEAILWEIRTEIVRIAGIPGYETEKYDRFSESLDAIFENLGATHSPLFNTVFDASFRSDLDSAVQESVSASQ